MILLIPVFISAGCNKDEEQPLLDNSYQGSITYEYRRDLPDINALSTLQVTLDRDGNLSSGGHDAASFDEEGIKYEGTTPVLKLHMTGTIRLESAYGNYAVVNGEEKVLVFLHSIIEGTLEVYGWDDEIGFFLVTTQDFTYEDEYSDGSFEFSLGDSQITGSAITITLPDIEGTSTYGYTLRMTPELNP